MSAHPPPPPHKKKSVVHKRSTDYHFFTGSKFTVYGISSPFDMSFIILLQHNAENGENLLSV